MELNVIFATALGTTKHLELLDSSREWFKQVPMDAKTNPGVNGIFVTSLKDYGAGGDNTVPIPDGPDLDRFKEVVLKNARLFLEGCGYEVDKYDFRIANIWLNEMTSESYHSAHNHYGKVVSGCFYVDVPENSGNIMFTGPLSRVDKPNITARNYTAFNSGTWTINPEPGSMLMWESYLIHEVPKTSFEGIRRSIAFDVSIETKG